MSSLTRLQLRAARALLMLRQEELADKAGIGLATLRRFENGNDVGQASVDALRQALEDEGAILVPAGALVTGQEVGGGVVLRPDPDLPDGLRARIAAFAKSSEKAAEGLPPERRTAVGRRSRIPISPKLRKPADG